MLLLKIQYAKKIKEPRTILYQTIVIKMCINPPKVRNVRRTVRTTILTRHQYSQNLAGQEVKIYNILENLNYKQLISKPIHNNYTFFQIPMKY